MQTTRWSETDQRSHINTTEQNNTAHRQIAGGLVETTNENEMKTEKMAPITGTENQMKEKSQINPETEPRQTVGGSQSMTQEIGARQTLHAIMTTSMTLTADKQDTMNSNTESTCEPRIQTASDVQNIETATRTEAQEASATFNVAATTGTTASGNSGNIEIVRSDSAGDERVFEPDDVDSIPLTPVVHGLIQRPAVIHLQGFGAHAYRWICDQSDRRKKYLRVSANLKALELGKPWTVNGKVKTSNRSYWKKKFYHQLAELADGVANADVTHEEWKRLAYGPSDNQLDWSDMAHLAVQLAIAVATGTKFLGYETVRGDVIIVGSENFRKEIGDAVEVVAGALGCPVPENLRLQEFDDDDFGAAYSTFKMMMRTKPSMIIFDHECLSRGSYWRSAKMWSRSGQFPVATLEYALSVKLLPLAAQTSLVFVEMDPDLQSDRFFAGHEVSFRFTHSGTEDHYQLDGKTPSMPRWQAMHLVRREGPLMLLSHDPTKALRQPVKDTESR